MERNRKVERHNVLMESLSRKQLIVLILGAFVLWLLLIITCALSPNEVDVVSEYDIYVLSDGTREMKLELHNMTTFNRQIVFNANIHLESRQNLTTLNFTGWQFTIPGIVEKAVAPTLEQLLDGYSSNDQVLRVQLHVIDFIHQASYEAKLHMPPDTIIAPVLFVKYDTGSFTTFDIGFRTVLAFCTLLVASYFVYLSTAKQGAPRLWYYEQRWILGLLILLIFFNNPFTIARYIIDSVGFFEFVNTLCFITFIVATMFALLVFADALSIEPSHRTFKRVYLPKLILLGIVFVLSLIVFLWQSISGLVMITSYFYQICQVVLVMAIVVYFVYLIYCLIRTFRTLHRLKKRYSIRFRVVWYFTFSVIVISIIALIGFIYLHQAVSTALFMLHATMTMYMFVLAALFLPSETPYAVLQRKFGHSDPNTVPTADQYYNIDDDVEAEVDAEAEAEVEAVESTEMQNVPPSKRKAEKMSTGSYPAASIGASSSAAQEREQQQQKPIEESTVDVEAQLERETEQQMIAFSNEDQDDYDEFMAAPEPTSQISATGIASTPTTTVEVNVPVPAAANAFALEDEEDTELANPFARQRRTI